MPSTSDIRPWMTLRYLATHYRVPVPSLVERLAVPPETNPDTSLRSLAESSSLSPFDFVKRTQLAVADITPPEAAQQQNEESSWLTRLSDDLLSALLIYGYPIMALILFFGAIGLPVPTGERSTFISGEIGRDAHSRANKGRLECRLLADFVDKRFDAGKE